MDNASNQLDEVKELARLFEIQAERINRLVERDRAGDPVPYFSREIEAATKLLLANYRIKEAQGLVGPPAQEDAMAKLQFTKYSQRTVEVLSNPESRHRIMSLLERVVRYGKGSPEMLARLNEMKNAGPVNGKALPALDLPLPRSEAPAVVVESEEEEKTPGDG